MLRGQRNDNTHVPATVVRLIRSGKTLVGVGGGKKIKQHLPGNFVILFGGVFRLLGHTHRWRGNFPASHWLKGNKGRSDWWNSEYSRKERKKKSCEIKFLIYPPRVLFNVYRRQMANCIRMLSTLSCYFMCYIDCSWLWWNRKYNRRIEEVVERKWY